MHCVCRNKFKARMWPSWEATRLSGPVETATPLNRGPMSHDKGQLALDLENILRLLEPWDSQRRPRGAARLLSGDLGWLQVSGGDPNLEKVSIQLTTLQGSFGELGGGANEMLWSFGSSWGMELGITGEEKRGFLKGIPQRNKPDSTTRSSSPIDWKGSQMDSMETSHKAHVLGLLACTVFADRVLAWEGRIGSSIPWLVITKSEF